MNNIYSLRPGKTAIIFSLIIFLISVFTPSGYGQYTKWKRDTIVNGVDFKKVRFRTGNSEGLYINGYLKENTIIDGYPCYKSVTLSIEGKIKIFILSEDYEIAGNRLKKNTQVIITGSGDYWIHCLYDPIIQGYNIRRENYRRLFFMGSTNFQLHPNGKLKYFQPVDPIEIQGVLCRPSPTWGGIGLYKSGKLKSCTSAGNQIIQGTTVEKNFVLEFAEDGILTHAKKENFF